ncbi:hypothetical protein Ancab_033998, partial [Ancistrocladus abbreviatus]
RHNPDERREELGVQNRADRRRSQHQKNAQLTEKIIGWTNTPGIQIETIRVPPGAHPLISPQLCFLDHQFRPMFNKSENSLIPSEPKSPKNCNTGNSPYSCSLPVESAGPLVEHGGPITWKSERNIPLAAE